jgi:hypothetical protein
MRCTRYLNPDYLWKRRFRARTKLASLAFYLPRRSGIAVSHNDKQILDLQDCHKGKRAFILGNGPSLKISDLDKLKNEITFASNKIYLAFDQTQWRPTYYFVFDSLVARNNAETIRALNLPKFFSGYILDVMHDCEPAIWLRDFGVECYSCSRAKGQIVEARNWFSKNLLLGVGSAETVIYPQLQVAYYMGIREVFLMGVDFSFSVPETVVKTSLLGYERAVESSGEVNHFHPDYRKPGEVWAIPRMQVQLRGFSLAKEVFEEDGGVIYNASRRTLLEVYPRVDTDAALSR